MKFVLIIGFLLAGLSFSGCAIADRSVLIETDKTDAYTSAQYRDTRSGQMGSWGPSFPWRARQGDSDPEKFARAVAIINYSKKLSRIKYDECGGAIAYEFEQPLVSSVKTTPMEPGTKLKRRSSFGHQPVE